MASKEELLQSYKNDKEKEIIDFEARLDSVHTFSQKIKCFEDIIIKRNLTGNERSIDFGETFKDIYLSWGIRRHFYESSKNITNCKKGISDKYLTKIYINTLTLYNLHENFGLYESLSNVNIFFTDKLNTNFYVEDEHVEEFLETLNEWYLKAKELAKRKHCENKIEELQKKLKEELEKLEALE